MAYIGNTVQNQGFSPAVDYFNGDGTTVTFTLSRPVASVAQLTAVIENVIQNPSTAFTVAGNSITFTSAPPAGTSNIWVEYTSLVTTYAAISQDPSVIGDITATGGYLAEGDFGNSYIDGTIVDYVTGMARITTGPADGITLYNGGTSARNALLSLNTAGAIGVGASPSYGTVGQVLTSQGSGSPPIWASTSTGIVSYLVVAGGGGGGRDAYSANRGGGGGGGGGFLASNLPVAGGISYTVTVGAGGAGGTGSVDPDVNGSDGSNSVFSSITATGGGGGGGHSTGANNAGRNGGSGGGGANAASGGSGTSGQGYAGGTGGPDAPYMGAGGGGASAVGSSVSSGQTTGGNGGAGTASSISGSSVTYAGGGGGGGGGGSAGGSGGSGGGGAGSTTGTATSGTANTGGGGGASRGTTGNGGSGIVIISYPSGYKLATATGTYTQTTSGGNYIFTFTGSGTITF